MSKVVVHEGDLLAEKLFSLRQGKFLNLHSPGDTSRLDRLLKFSAVDIPIRLDPVVDSGKICAASKLCPIHLKVSGVSGSAGSTVIGSPTSSIELRL